MTRVLQHTKRGGQVVKPEGAPSQSNAYQGLRSDPTARELMFRRLLERHTSDAALIEEMVRDFREGRIKITRAGKIKVKR